MDQILNKLPNNTRLVYVVSIDELGNIKKFQTLIALPRKCKKLLLAFLKKNSFDNIGDSLKKWI